MYEGVDDCMDILDDKTGPGVDEFVGILSCKSVEVGRSVNVSVSAVVPVAAEFWTTSPNVSAVLGVEEEAVKVQSSLFVMSGEEEILCVAVCVPSLLVCVNWEDV